MNTQDIFKAIEAFESNAIVGLIVILYYVLIYWPKIKDGLGLSRNRKYDLNRVEKNYQLLKLRIEIEELKQKSGLDSDLLEKLETEMQSRLQGERGKPFTPAQKFVAIPLVILVVLLTVLELQGLNDSAEGSALDILAGAAFVITVTVVGFWGIPLLQTFKRGWLRKTGFIIYWWLALYILSYFAAFLIATLIFGYEELPMEIISLLFLLSIAVSLVAGFFGRLPFMRLRDEEKQESSAT
ncbi:hypothetical protein SAMN02745165_01407 [Malonomonas rubra DSM 5091]|uniref:Uncharacterized protein n=1 Tax=Malonomonas rubra DSM 5091 TaxID=1122189 RepID=A0A1M6G4R7_MALRU|nr:hypothetical protein [Malonomonas rubra]SHJ04893.1 hypothetical protein SAMN02745165_01407 [Malonomonas rubra DSM 5091]